MSSFVKSTANLKNLFFAVFFFYKFLYFPSGVDIGQTGIAEVLLNLYAMHFHPRLCGTILLRIESAPEEEEEEEEV